jgi:anti-sigma B factor antagonist
VTRPDNGAPPFDANVEREDDVIAMRLTGEFDLAAKDDFEAGVEDALSAPVSSLVLDLGGLRFVDSTGLSAILTLWERSQQDGFALSILRGPPDVQRTFRVTGLDRMLPFSAEASPPGGGSGVASQVRDR